MTEFENKFQKAEQYFNEKKYLHALQIYQSLTEIPEYQRKAAVKLIEIYDIQNQLQSAIDTFEKYLSKIENDENMRTFYAQFLIRHHKYSEANYILSGISVTGRPEKNFLMGISHYYLDDYEVALINFLDFIAQNKKSDLIPEAHLYIGRCYLKTAELDLALTHLKKSEELYKQNYQVYFLLAEVYYLKEMYYHALEHIQKSIELNPSETASLELNGKIFFKLGELKKARKEFEHLLTYGKNDSELLALLGTICINLKDIQSANSYFKSALDINPSNETAHKGLTQCEALVK